MDILYELSKHPTFTIQDVDKYYDNIESARSAVKRMLSGSRAVKIRNNLYTCINPVTGGPVADRFQIASALTETSYVSHHSAMEYHGISDQVFYDVYVSSETRFTDFDFDGYTFHFVQSRLSEGIDEPSFSGGIRVTCLERTVADSIKDMDKISGLEEVWTNINSIRAINEDKLLHYLELYSNQFQYQKTGYLLSKAGRHLNLSDNFYDICKSHIGYSKRYLTRDISDCKYNRDWMLVVPSDLETIKNGREIINATI